MTVDALITIVVLVGLLVVLARTQVAPAVATLAAAIGLLLTGVITADEAFAGFSSSAVMTVGALFVIAGAVERTGILTALVGRVVRSDRPALMPLLLPIAGLSSVMNNTPIVAAVAPAVVRSCAREGLSPSRYLMPMSYATILGGIVTTIGTSTNLVVSGLLVERGLPPFSLTEMTPIGLPVAVVGLVMMGLTATRLLPERQAPEAQVRDEPRRHAVDLEVVAGGALDGVEVRASGLRNLPSVYLAARREDGAIRPLGRRSVLHGGDILRFVGDARQVAPLVADGTLVPAPEVAAPGGRAADPTSLVEVVIDGGTGLVGRTLKEVGFRGRFGAVVLSVHRDGAPVEGRLGDVRLHTGDVLLLLCDDEVVEALRDGDDFAVVAPLVGTDDLPTAARRVVPLVIALAMVGAAASGLVDILLASLAAVLALLVTRSITARDARRSIDLDVLVLIASSFALGAAVDASGLASRAADLAILAADSGGRPFGVLAVVLMTMMLTEPLSNAAAAGLMVPIALQVADGLGGDPRVFAVSVAIASSASFLTPIGYQTNIMVYGLGGYRFGDYARLGAPLSAVSLVLIVAGVLVTGF